MKPEEIIHEISEKAGISQDQARTAFMASLEYIKTKLPDSVSSQLTGLLEGKPFDYNLVAKEKLNEIRDEAEEKLEILKEETKETLEELTERIKKIMDKLL